MTFFSDDRANELRNIFFESAQELLQALNEDGLALEQDPTNSEVVRTIRRTMHTLKGDSAACGYRELSELAHAMEDVLTPEIAARSASALAQVVLSAADTFDEMLAAYKGNMRPPSDDSLRAMIAAVLNPETAQASAFSPEFNWTEDERLEIAKHALAGQNLFEIGLQIDPQCPMRAAALQLIRNVMQEVGTVVVMNAGELVSEAPEVLEGVLATYHEQDWIEKKCKVPAVVSRIAVRKYVAAPPPTVQELEEEPLFAHPVTEPIELAPEPIVETEQDLLGLMSATAAENSPAPKLERKTPSLASENILRVEAERIDSVLDLVGELIISKSILLDAIGDFAREFPKHPLRNKFADAMAYQSQVLHQLQRSVMKVRMVPVEQLFRRFPRVVRDVAKLESKNVHLVLKGENTDLDKSILDALAEPLTHLVRNAVGHGIESPEERAAAGKPEQGTITLNAYHQGNQVVIEVSDDGRGIDKNMVVRKALEKHVVTRDEVERLNDKEALSLIFQAGFSTADHVTEVSGRGVGMDVVKTVLERLKGTVAIDTELGKGTTFQLRLPLTLAIIKALLFRLADQLYAVPLGAVLEITRASESDIHVVDNHEVLQLREELLTLVRLDHLKARAPQTKGGKLFIVVVSLGHRKFGLIVDRLWGEQELVIKALDDTVVTTDLVSGASVLGDGRVVLILNIAAVVDRVGHRLTVAAGARA